MKNPLQSEVSLNTAQLLARVPLGVVMALAGYMKFRHGGVEHFVASNLSNVPAYMPSWFGNVYLHAVPFAELGVGLLLIAGCLTRMSGLLAVLLLVSFGMIHPGVTGFINTEPADASKLFQAPLIYAVFAMVTFLAGPGRFSVDHLLWHDRPASRRSGTSKR